MITGVAFAAALHLSGPERFFCDDLVNETLAQCVKRTRREICTLQLPPQKPGDRTLALFYRTVGEERRVAGCRLHP